MCRRQTKFMSQVVYSMLVKARPAMSQWISEQVHGGRAGRRCRQDRKISCWAIRQNRQVIDIQTGCHAGRKAGQAMLTTGRADRKLGRENRADTRDKTAWSKATNKLIRLIEENAKCDHLKKWELEKDFVAAIYLSEAPSPPRFLSGGGPAILQILNLVRYIAEFKRPLLREVQKSALSQVY